MVYGMVDTSRSTYGLTWLLNCIAFLCSHLSVGQAQTNSRFELTAIYKLASKEPSSLKIKKLTSLITQWERNQLSADSTYVNIHLDLAKTLSDNQRPSESIALLKKVVVLYQKVSSALKAEDIAKTYHRLAISYQHNGNFATANHTLRQGIQVCRFMPSSRWVSYMYSTLAFYLYQSGDYQQALVQSEQAIRIGEAAHSDRAVANGLFEKAKALRELGRIRETRADLERAIQLAEKNQELAYDLSLYYVTLAYVCKAETKANEGISYFQKAIALNQQLNDSLGIATNSTEFGYFLYDLGNYDVAATVLTKAIPFSPASHITARALDNLGAVYWKKKQFIPALTTYQRGLRILIRGFKSQVPDSLPLISAIRTSAYKEYVFTLIQDKADTWLDYAKATNNTQRLRYALNTYKVADQMIDFMRWEHTGQQSKLYWRQKTRGMYERAIETSYRLGDAAQAFQFFEKSRAAMLADKLNELGARQQLTSQQVQEEQHFRQAVSEQQNKLAAIPSDKSADYKKVRVRLDIKQDSLNDFLKRLEASNPAYYRYKYDTTVISLAHLRRHLSTNKASYVTYFVGDSALYVLGVTPDTAMLIRQPVQAHQKNMRAFMALLNNPSAMNRRANRDQFLTLGNNLYRQLLAHLNLHAGSVIVSPDGSFVPFEALSRKVAEPDYLVNDYAFSYTYSARLLLKKWGDSPKNNTHQCAFLGIAPVNFAPSLKQVKLPGSEEALNLIADRFYSPTLLTHQAATRRAFLTKAVDAGVIQLFTHASADSTGQEPMLYFADSTLKLSKLGDGSLPNAQLVVLAACKTGIGANQRGEGVFSLARGFAALGVPSVLTTLWSVQNEATYDLTDLFYKYLDEGWPKDIALQRAKLDWLKDADQTNQLPNFWAGLIIVGDTEPLERTNSTMWLVILPLLLITGVGGWLWRRQIRKSMPPVSFSRSA